MLPTTSSFVMSLVPASTSLSLGGCQGRGSGEGGGGEEGEVEDKLDEVEKVEEEEGTW